MDSSCTSVVPRDDLAFPQDPSGRGTAFLVAGPLLEGGGVGVGASTMNPRNSLESALHVERGPEGAVGDVLINRRRITL